MLMIGFTPTHTSPLTSHVRAPQWSQHVYLEPYAPRGTVHLTTLPPNKGRCCHVPVLQMRYNVNCQTTPVCPAKLSAWNHNPEHKDKTTMLGTDTPKPNPNGTPMLHQHISTVCHSVAPLISASRQHPCAIVRCTITNGRTPQAESRVVHHNNAFGHNSIIAHRTSTPSPMRSRWPAHAGHLCVVHAREELHPTIPSPRRARRLL